MPLDSLREWNISVMFIRGGLWCSHHLKSFLPPQYTIQLPLHSRRESFFQKTLFPTKGKSRVVSHNNVDKMLNAFTMHSFLLQCLAKMLPLCLCAWGLLEFYAVASSFFVRGGAGNYPLTSNNQLINLFTNQFNSL